MVFHYTYINNCFKVGLVLPLVLVISSLWVNYNIRVATSNFHPTATTTTSTITTMSTSVSTSTTTAQVFNSINNRNSTVDETVVSTYTMTKTRTDSSLQTTMVSQTLLQNSIWEQINKTIDKVNKELFVQQYIPYINTTVVQLFNAKNASFMFYKDQLSTMKTEISNSLQNKSLQINDTIDYLYKEGVVVLDSDDSDSILKQDLHSMRLSSNMFNQMFDESSTVYESHFFKNNMTLYYEEYLNVNKFELSSSQTAEINNFINSFFVSTSMNSSSGESQVFINVTGFDIDDEYDGNDYNGTTTLNKRYIRSDREKIKRKVNTDVNKTSWKWKTVSLTVFSITVYLIILLIINIIELQKHNRREAQKIEFSQAYLEKDILEDDFYIDQIYTNNRVDHEENRNYNKRGSICTHVMEMLCLSKWLYLSTFTVVIIYLLMPNLNLNFKIDDTIGYNTHKTTDDNILFKRNVFMNDNISVTSLNDPLPVLNNELNAIFTKYLDLNIWGIKENNLDDNSTPTIMQTYFNRIGGHNYTLESVDFRNLILGTNSSYQNLFPYPQIQFDFGLLVQLPTTAATVTKQDNNFVKHNTRAYNPVVQSSKETSSIIKNYTLYCQTIYEIISKHILMLIFTLVLITLVSHLCYISCVLLCIYN